MAILSDFNFFPLVIHTLFSFAVLGSEYSLSMFAPISILTFVFITCRKIIGAETIFLPLDILALKSVSACKIEHTLAVCFAIFEVA